MIHIFIFYVYFFLFILSFFFFAFANPGQMDQLIKGVKWNWEHQKTYAVVKSGSGYIDVDVVSKYRLDGRSKLPTTKPPRPPTKKTVKPPRPPTNKNPPKPLPYNGI